MVSSFYSNSFKKYLFAYSYMVSVILTQYWFSNKSIRPKGGILFPGQSARGNNDKKDSSYCSELQNESFTTR